MDEDGGGKQQCIKLEHGPTVVPGMCGESMQLTEAKLCSSLCRWNPSLINKSIYISAIN